MADDDGQLMRLVAEWLGSVRLRNLGAYEWPTWAGRAAGPPLTGVRLAVAVACIDDFLRTSFQKTRPNNNRKP